MKLPQKTNRHPRPPAGGGILLIMEKIPAFAGMTVYFGILFIKSKYYVPQRPHSQKSFLQAILS
jgi:hypothetical protein